MKFLFKPQEELNKHALFQGDLLARTPALRDAVRKAHSYYADAEDYTHFMVLTQSCDLVIRGKRPPKSRYITICAVRPTSIVFERHKAKYVETIEGLPTPVYSLEKKLQATQLLERLLHNTEDGLFFIRKGSVEGVTEDLCAFLSLSVALRAEEHYAACAASKIAELEDVFAAKLGWLVGNMYSRVGTPDFEEKAEDPATFKAEFIDQFLDDSTNWLSDLQIKWLRDQSRDWAKLHDGHEMSAEDAARLIREVPLPSELLADQIIKVLERSGGLDPAARDRTRNMLASDRVLKRVSR